MLRKSVNEYVGPRLVGVWSTGTRLLVYSPTLIGLIIRFKIVKNDINVKSKRISDFLVVS